MKAIRLSALFTGRLYPLPQVIFLVLISVALYYNRKVAASIPDGVIGFFRSHYGSGVNSTSNRNEYQEYFLGVKAAGA
jgi:hypothetical protein